jgi:hypothetical protein
MALCSIFTAYEHAMEHRARGKPSTPRPPRGHALWGHCRAIRGESATVREECALLLEEAAFLLEEAALVVGESHQLMATVPEKAHPVWADPQCEKEQLRTVLPMLLLNTSLPERAPPPTPPTRQSRRLFGKTSRRKTAPKTFPVLLARLAARTLTAAAERPRGQVPVRSSVLPAMPVMMMVMVAPVPMRIPVGAPWVIVTVTPVSMGVAVRVARVVASIIMSMRMGAVVPPVHHDHRCGSDDDRCRDAKAHVDIDTSLGRLRLCKQGKSQEWDHTPHTYDRCETFHDPILI